jgi:hypothetical protein
MKLKSGHFNLFSVLEFAANNPTPLLPKSNRQKLYQKIISGVVSGVPSNKPGWYLWGRFNDTGWWETIYLGKAGKQKTSSLHTRLYDELREENIAFWASIFGRESTIKQWALSHKASYKNKFDPIRALRKIGSQFVIWVATDEEISEEAISGQEEILIKVYRPTHNARRPGYVKHDALTEEIERAIEGELEIIKARNNGSNLVK